MGQRTAWRLTNPQGEIACRIIQTSNRQAAVAVTTNGHRLERVEYQGEGDEPLHQAWQKALALHEKYRASHDAPLPVPATSTHDPAPADPRTARAMRVLLPAVLHVEQSRRAVIHCLTLPDRRGTATISAVKVFRAAWERLDLEYHMLTGVPLTAHAYRQLRDTHARAGVGEANPLT